MKDSEKKTILEQMIGNGEFDYGAQMPITALLAQFDVYRTPDEKMEGMSPSQIRKLIEREKLEEVGVIYYIRDHLLKHGRYLDVHHDTVRVALPNENRKYADKYFEKSKRYFRKAEALLTSTPPEHIPPNDPVAIRLLRHREAEKRMRNH